MMGEIISFYSFKGGVGRTMAVANLAVLLAQRGKRVLVVDFDLEAPGLDRYFCHPNARVGEQRYQPKRVQNGVIELFEELRIRIDDEATPATLNGEPRDPRPAIPTIVQRLLEAGEYGYHIRVTDPSSSKQRSLRFLPAGRFDTEYADRVRRFPWERLYEEEPAAFDELAKAWREEFDYILVDSRTGLSDIGSVSTVILPDKLVLAFVPNEQSLHGVIQTGRQAFELKRRIQPDSNLAIFPLVSRVDGTEELQKRSYLQDAAKRFGQLFDELYGVTDIDFNTYFQDVHVPHKGYYAYGEKIAIEEDKPTSMDSPALGYDRFFSVLREPRLMWGTQQNEFLKTRQIRKTAVIASAETELEPPHADFQSILRIPKSVPKDSSIKLRAIPIQPEPWNVLLSEIDEGINRVKQESADELHLFPMMPHAAAVYLGRKVDELLQGRNLHIHQLEPTSREWIPFSFPRKPKGISSDSFFEEFEGLSGQQDGNSVLLAIEGMIQIQDRLLASMTQQYGIKRVIRLRPRKLGLLTSPDAIYSAIVAIREALAKAAPGNPSGAIHIVTTAPLALLIELGRLARPTVFKSVIVHQFNAQTHDYIPVLDVMTRQVITRALEA